MALLAGACSNGITGIGVGLPDANANTGAYLVDTITVRASTVLRDSVVSSSSSYLLAGRYTDPLLGTIQAKSYFRLGLGALFTPDATAIYDSVVLVLKPDTYRYGDTTKTQTLFSVYPMTTLIADNKVSFTSPKLTPLSYDINNRLNASASVVRRARPNISTLRLRLNDNFGRKLLAQGQSGQLQTQDQFIAAYPGLAVVGADNDDAALVRMSATSSDTGLFLYYHLPTDATTVLSTSFLISSGGGHCFQVTADRSMAGIQNLPQTSLQKVSASQTGEQTFIEGALGLQTKLEFPYLDNVNQLGQHLTITSASLTAEVASTTLTNYLPTPPNLSVSLSNINNQPVSTYISSVSYTPGTSVMTGLDQGSYTWSMSSYVTAVLNHTYANNGILLTSTTPELPTRVVLGSQRHPLNKLKFRVYLISVD